jgi:hypothetical protein
MGRLAAVTMDRENVLQNIAGGHSSLDVGFRHDFLGESGSPGKSVANET